MHAFVSSIPDFRVLTHAEQQSLIERNLHGIFCLGSGLVFRDSGMINSPVCITSTLATYGMDTLMLARRLNSRLDFDPIFIKLMLIVLAFSSNCFVVDVNKHMPRDSLRFGTFRLLGSQTIYVELLWKYIVHRYGYYQAAIRFQRLIVLLLDRMKYAVDLYTQNPFHYEFIQETKCSSQASPDDQSLLWGKT